MVHMTTRSRNFAWWKNPGTYFALVGLAFAALLVVNAIISPLGGDWSFIFIWLVLVAIGVVMFFAVGRMESGHRRSGGILIAAGLGVAAWFSVLGLLTLTLERGNPTYGLLVAIGVGLALAGIGFAQRVLRAVESPKRA